MKDIRILLCEDDPSLGRLLSDYLKAKGFEVTWAQDGVEGLKAFHRETYDFIVLDVMMPRKDGFQVAEEIRLESRSIPILFLTARSTKDDTLEGFKVGGDDYMTKPFSMEELVLRIQAILRRSAPRCLKRARKSPSSPWDCTPTTTPPSRSTSMERPKG